MPAIDVLTMAWEALRSNKLRAGLTMLGMIIGVAAVVLLVSIGNGARNYITTQFQGMGTNLIMVQPGKTDARGGFGPPVGASKRRITLRDIEALERGAVNLEAVTGLTFGAGSVSVPDRTVNISLIGSNEQLPAILSIRIQHGRFFSGEEHDSGRRVIVLGHAVAGQLFAGDNPLGRMVKVNEAEFRVVGVLKRSGQSLGFHMDEMAFLPTRASMRIFNEDKLFGIRAKAKARVSMQDAVEDIRRILIERHGGEEDFTVVTQDAMLDTMNTILGMLTYVLGGIAMISMVVGGIGIMNIMLVSVTERTREIGIRRAVGARRIDILKQFLAEAMTLSMAGGLLGLIVATAITWAITLASGGAFDMRAPVWILWPAFGMSFLTGVLFGVWPALKAARIATIDALRYE